MESALFSIRGHMRNNLVCDGCSCIAQDEFVLDMNISDHSTFN